MKVEPNSGQAFGTDSTQAIGGLAEFDLDAPLGEGLSPQAQAAIDALPATSALLVVQRGPNAGSRFLLDADSTTAGRSTKSDIFLDDVTVSRRHATFGREGSDFAVRDLGSLNGTYVNRERVDEALLRGGDEVQIGKYRLTFHPSPSRPA
ncbi:MAG: FHA domain-containing protein [Bifidobacteriaceae bacterium]|jgi:pSer/pThr/pTyr-binding forkhead associated (FHA) protein|nr:FHA domain-containing protein [Bifidobacteriaceae bacterium]